MVERPEFQGRRVLASVGFGLLVVVLIAEFGALGWISHDLNTQARRASVSVAGLPSTLPSTSPVTTAPVSSLPAGTTSVPSTVPTGVSAPTVSTSGTITYTVPAGTEAQLSVTADCWVDARTSATGPILLATTVTPGETETLQAPVRMRFGNPSVATVSVGGTKLKLPDSAVGVLVLQSS